MANLERDKFLSTLIGECWHDGANNYGEIVCAKCHKLVMVEDRVDFSTWEGFGKLWEWAQKQEWFKEVPFNFDENRYHDCYMLFPVEFVNPDRFADAVYEHLKRV